MFNDLKRKLLLVSLLLVSPLLSYPRNQCLADDIITTATPRFILYWEKRYTQNTATKNIQSRHKLIKETSATLNQIHEQLVELFDYSPDNRIVLRFLNPSDFQKRTGAPAWTSAMFYKDEISIPLDEKSVNLEEIKNSAKHEYIHAFLSSASNKRIPAWLDEGIAQLLEGSPNPLLGPALREWIDIRDALPLSSLNDGFIGLENHFVPVAYAQSLFVTRSLVNRFGFKSLSDYVKLLREDADYKKSFRLAFHSPLEEFEEELTIQIARWAKSDAAAP